MDGENIEIFFCHFQDSEYNDKIFENLKTFIIKDNHKVEANDRESADLIILFVRMQDLHSSANYNKIVAKGLREIADYSNRKLKNYQPLPIIVIGLEKLKNDKDNNVGNNIFESLNLDPRVNFFDSSIWHRYVALDENFLQNFSAVLQGIIALKNNYIYETSVAREFLEFKTRMMVNSFLPAQGISGHATHVTPYQFHSESRMQREKKMLQDKLGEVFKKLRWKFLLIDDYALNPLRKFNDGSTPSGNDPVLDCNDKKIPTKACIVKNILEDIFKFENGPKEEQREVEIKEWEKYKTDTNGFKGQDHLLVCVNSLDVAKEALKTEMFDMIFLDYLLGERDGGAREFGSELLREIQNNEDIQENAGPLGKFWIFPISAFSYAMMDELREQGYGYLSDYWHISAGADPINTPWLFKYKLIKFLGEQLSSILAAGRTGNENNGSEDMLVNFLNLVFNDENKIKESARSKYHDFLELKGLYLTLLNDKDKGGLLADSLVKMEQKEAKILFEHLHYLIYHLAYGSEAEWETMWEEYLHIKNHLKNKPYASENEKFLENIKNRIITCQKKYR